MRVTLIGNNKEQEKDTSEKFNPARPSLNKGAKFTINHGEASGESERHGHGQIRHKKKERQPSKGNRSRQSSADDSKVEVPKRAVSAADLDAEMEAYMASKKK